MEFKNNTKRNKGMSKKIKKILKKVEQGKIISIHNFNITLEEFLSKDENDITFLEYLLKNNIFIGIDNIRNSIDAAKIFCKCNEELADFIFDEEELFSYNNGTRFVDFLVQNNKLTPDIINSIKDHIEIVDILIDNKILNLLTDISDEIVNKLITLNSNGKYPIEKYMDNDLVITTILPLINNPSELITICQKNNKYNLLEYVNPNVLMYNIKENYTLLDDLLNKNIIPKSIRYIPDNEEFILFLRKKKLYDYLLNCSQKSFLMELENGKTLLEEIIDNSNFDKLDTYVTEKEIIKILYDKNRLDAIVDISESLLVADINEIFNFNKNQTLLDYLIDNGHESILETINWDICENWDVIKILYNRGEYQLLFEKLDDFALLMVLEKGILLIDKLLENNIQPGEAYISSPELITIFFRKGRLDLLATADLELLFETVDSEKTYFDYFLEAIKTKKIKCNLNDSYLFGYDVNTVAKFYLTLAKHDMIKYVNELTKEDLLAQYYDSDENEQSLLIELLNLDSTLTLQKIIPEKVKSEMEIAVILKSRGLEQNDVNLSTKNDNFTSEYLTKFNSRLGIGPVQGEGEFLLKKLEDLFLNDGKSDPQLIRVLISCYKHALILGYNVYINELRNLVEVKEKNMHKFVYLKDPKEAYFRPITGEVYSNDNVVGTLLHETGHALHSYLISEKIPYQCEMVIERVRKNTEVLRKVEKFSKQYNEIKQKLIVIVEEECKIYFEKYYTPETKEELEKFLTKSFEEKKEEFKSLDIPENILDIILKESFTIEQFINHQKRIYKKEKIDAILGSEYDCFVSISDILDAIYEGELNSEYLKNENGEKIKKAAGHGVSYYYDNMPNIFSEMVANFSSICKSPQAYEMLKLLKDIIGEELYEMLSIFYYTNIVKLEEDQVDSLKKI